MCIVCIEWESGKLTSKEALGALGEMIRSTEEYDEQASHYWEVSNKIVDKEVPFSNSDQELDKSWHDETHEFD